MSLRPSWLTQVALVLLGLGPLFAVRAQSPDAEELKHAAGSPFTLRNYIARHRTLSLVPLWQTLKLTGMVGETSFVGVQPDGARELVNKGEKILDECEDDCEVTLHTVALDGEPGSEVLLRLAKPNAEEFRYLLFGRVRNQPALHGGWRLVGHVDYAFSRYFEPRHRVVAYGNRRWLVFRAQEVSGSGVYLAGQDWYELSDGQLRPVLSLPSDGSQSFTVYDPTRKFSVAVIGHEREGSEESLFIRFTVSYGIWGDRKSSNNRASSLGTHTAVAVYRRRAETSRFELDPAHSKITSDEIESVFEVDSFDENDFLMYNFENLKLIASNDRAPAHQWLAAYLRRCADSPQRAELIRLQTTKPSTQ